MSKKENKKNQQNQGAQQGNIDMDRDLGNKAQGGATSTNREKSRLQNVENAGLDNMEEGNGGTRTTDMDERGTYSVDRKNDMNDNRSGEGVSDKSFVDSGYTRTAAFDEGGEPRSPESLENRGTTQGSDDDNHAGIIKTTNYGPDMPGSWREPERRGPGGGGAPDSSYRSSADTIGRMRD